MSDTPTESTGAASSRDSTRAPSSAPVINHQEALELAAIKQDESNLARCYLDLREDVVKLGLDASLHRKESVFLRSALADFLGDAAVYGDGDAESYPTVEQVVARFRAWASEPNK